MTEPAPEELLEQCLPRLQNRIRWMMGERARRHADSGDFVSELCLKVLEDARKLRWRDAEHFLQLATRIARNLIIDSTRRKRVQAFESFATNLTAGQIAERGGATPSVNAAGEESIERLLQVLEDLPATDQTVIELRTFEGLSFDEIGTRMNRTAAAAQVLHRRAVARLGRRIRTQQ